MKLRELAHARSGDKGDVSNISVIAYDRTGYERIRAALTPERVRRHLRDIVVTEEKRAQTSDYQTLIRITVRKANRDRTVAGTIVGGKPRLVEIEGISLEAEMTGNMLLVRNTDRPGMVGNLGRTLGDAGINIATFFLGRKAAGGDSIALLAVDQAVNDLVILNICALPNVNQVKLLKF